ncbi:MAG TPA: LPS assembly lipoprotein LptE [Steroidobacteraceae bacterium]|nr:LPS assembly lipoprotein LptE [Steroidobacteraceae bacterium]
MHAPGSRRCFGLPALALAPLLWLAGCGFHLQGRIELPRSLASASIDASDRQSDFYISLRAALHAAGAQLDGGGADAAIIRILDDSSSERILTVSARNTPTAYLLSYRVKVAVDYQGRELLPAEEHTLTREYSFDERELLAKQRESDILRQALADDLAALVMHRLAAL